MNLHVTLTGDDEWRAEGMLDYTSSQNPYYIWIGDSKTHAWVRDIFARVKGQQDWILLTHIEQDWAVFCLNKNGIYFPE